jgi:hypothetical protein
VWLGTPQRAHVTPEEFKRKLAGSMVIDEKRLVDGGMTNRLLSVSRES